MTKALAYTCQTACRPCHLIRARRLFPLGNLAQTLEQLAEAGLEDFYNGDIAARIADDVAAYGGIVDQEDLAGYKAEIRDASTIEWRGTHRVFTAGGLTAAPTLAEVIAGMDNALIGARPDAAWFAQLSSVMQRAYANRLDGLGAAQAATEPGDTCTTHVTVVDADGNLVSVTTTLLSSMGSRVVLPSTGIMMNNGIMWFDPQPGTPNAIRPSARPLCNMCPVIVTPIDGNWPRMAAGASGGRRILASVYQVLAWSLDFQLTPEEAAHIPRIDVSGPDCVNADRRLADNILTALRQTGSLSIVEHGVLPINFACPNFTIATGDRAVGWSDVVSPWSAAVAATAHG